MTAGDVFDFGEYPEGHSPFCLSDCDDPCHDEYDAEHGVSEVHDG